MPSNLSNCAKQQRDMHVFAFFLLIFFMQRLEEKTLWKAQILDAETGKALHSVHIRSQRDQTISDQNGYFKLWLEESTKVNISHVGYETTVLDIRPNTLLKTIFLKPLVMQLDQIEVSPYPSEADFKKHVLNNEYVPPIMQQNLNNNLTYMKSI